MSIDFRGVAVRSDLARTLSGYDEVRLEEWDRILMKNPKLTLVNTHSVLNYDPTAQAFSLNFVLKDDHALKQAQEICENSILSWIQRNSEEQKLDELEVLRLYRVLSLAKQREAYDIPEQLELDAEVEELAMQIVTAATKEKYPNERVTQQPYGTIGFDILVGNIQAPVAYIKVKATARLEPSFALSESERQFSIDNKSRYHLALVYSINGNTDECEVAYYTGAITSKDFMMLPQKWYLKPLKKP